MASINYNILAVAVRQSLSAGKTAKTVSRKYELQTIGKGRSYSIYKDI